MIDDETLAKWKKWSKNEAKDCGYFDGELSEEELHFRVTSLIGEIERLEDLLKKTWSIAHDDDVDADVYNFVWLECLRMGLDTLSEHQVRWMSNQDVEPYITALEIHHAKQAKSTQA